MKSLEEYDAADILDVIATNIRAISQINKNADNLTIICTCVFSTMACCCIDNTTDESKVTETVMKFSKEFEKTIDMLDEIAHDVDAKCNQK